MKRVILCDFDGTISVRDMGYVLLNRFSSGDWEAIDRDFCEGKIGSKEAYGRITKIIKGDLIKDKIFSEVKSEIAGLQEKYHKAMNDYQTRIGAIHDLEVLVDNVKSLRVRKSLQPQPPMPRLAIPANSLLRVQQRLQRQRAVLVRKFIQSADELYSFYNPDSTTS
jgi:hypothetical protein